MPAVEWSFPQVSACAFTYDISAPVGSRVTGAVRQAADGSAQGQRSITSASTYKIAGKRFYSSGGDGYPNFFDRATIQDISGTRCWPDYIAAATIVPIDTLGRQLTATLLTAGHRAHGAERHERSSRRHR